MALVLSAFLAGVYIDVMGKFEFRVFGLPFLQRSVVPKFGCLLPAWLLRSRLFFVRVNRFWCVWTRVLVSWMREHLAKLARVFGDGLSDLWMGKT